MLHELKCLPEYFKAILDDRKKHEIRDTSDRVFEVGDEVLLCEWSPSTGYTDEDILVEITWVSPPRTYGVPDGICVFSFNRLIRNKDCTFSCPSCEVKKIGTRHDLNGEYCAICCEAMDWELKEGSA